MAHVKLNPILEQIRGKVGDLVFKRFKDRTIVSRKSDPGGVPRSVAQAAQHERFRQAALYGRVVMADPEARAIYEAAARAMRKPFFSVMVGDFLNVPSVEAVDVSGYAGAAGDTITVTAADDFGVVGVQVALSDAEGAELEGGAAVQGADGRWVYTATTPVAPGTTVRFNVTASDRPGGTAEATAEKAL